MNNSAIIDDLQWHYIDIWYGTDTKHGYYMTRNDHTPSQRISPHITKYHKIHKMHKMDKMTKWRLHDVGRHLGTRDRDIGFAISG